MIIRITVNFYSILQKILSLFCTSRVLFFFFSIYISVGYTQKTETIDSLLTILSESPTDNNDIHLAIASEYYALADYSLSVMYYTKALNGYLSNSDTAKTAPSIVGLGNIYLQHNKNYEKAIEYYEKALDIYTDNKNIRGAALMYNNLGTCYLEMKKYDLAIDELQKSYKLKIKLNDSLSIHKTLNNIGILYFKQQQYSKAIDFYYQSLGANIKDLWSYSNTLNNLAELYIETYDDTKAKRNLDEALQVARDNSFYFVIKENYRLRVEFYSKQNNITQLRKYNELYLSLSDTLYNEKGLRLLTELQTKYETKEKESENEMLKAEQEIKNQRITTQNNKIITLIIVMVLIVIFALLFLRLYRNQLKANKILVSKNLEIIEREKKIKTILSEKNIIQKSADKKYAQSELKEEDRQGLIIAIEEFIDNKRLHLESGFSLKDLATGINSSRTFVSQVINEHYNCNFNSFINKHRVKEATILLSNPEYKNITIEAISKQAGFKSKSTFNKTFKQLTGVTPSFYLKTINQIRK